MKILSLAILAIVLMAAGIGVGIYAAYLKGQLEFLSYAHYVSLLLLLLAYILSWFAMTWMTHPEKFEVREKQWIAFGFTILMAIFWWGRYVFTIADSTERATINGSG